MTLLKKLEDTEEGLVGITEEGERVHLGVPKIYSHVHFYNLVARQRISGVVNLTCFEDETSNTEQIHKKIEELSKNLQEDLRAYWYIDLDKDSPFSFPRNEACFGNIYLRFDREKESAFQRGESSYFAGGYYEQKCIKIHRAKTK